MHFGLLSYKCEDEAEYLDEAEKFIMEIMACEDEDKIDDFFWGNPPDKEKLNNTLKNILRNIEKVRAIPFHKRKFDF